MTAAEIAKDPETTGVTIAVDSPDDNLDYPALGGGEIKGRGNFTWTLKKKPYQIKLKDAAPLLGMDSAKTWILLANHADASLMRNKIAFDLAGDIGMPFSPQSKWVDLRINGDYMGNYLLTEKVEVKANRVDLSDPSAVIAELDNNYGTAEDYYFRSTASKTVYTLKDQKGAVPSTVGDWNESAKTQATKVGWDDIKKDINTLDALLDQSTPDWAAISDLIDVESFVKMYLVQELTMNIDAANSSLYLYKNGTSDKLHAGPVWDFDITLGNYSRGEGSDTKSEFVKNLDVLRSTASPLWDDLFRNPDFVKQANAVWTEDVAYHASKLPSKIDDYKATVALSAANNFKRWSILGTPSLLGSSGGTYASSYSTEVSDLRSWVASRQSHLRKAYGDVPVLQYRAHVQSLGWLHRVNTGQIAGTVGQARRLEAFSLAKLTSPAAGSIQAKSHVQSIGWSSSWRSTDLVGTTGRGLRLEAFQLRLTSGLATRYNISYRAHVQGIGWQPWVTNGATAGTTGQAKRVEAVQVRILEKTSPTPVAPTP
ncbi:CotH kinase family protein [Fodinibacter luteus]|uniref:CotH kinase family protein n=1 Tax=Fodinibacter luteus TaxID=552064 RepID=UPI0031E5985B